MSRSLKSRAWRNPEKMNKSRVSIRRSAVQLILKIKVSVLLISTMMVLVIVMACASPQPTATPVPPQPPATPVAPQTSATPTAVTAPTSPTPVLATATPTRIAPTATPVAVAKPRYGGVLRYVPIALDAVTVDPRYGVARSELPPQILIFRNIVAVGKGWEIVPDLTKSWEFSADGKTVTFRLKEGIKFQDGTDLDANTIKWFFEWQLDPKTGHQQRGTLESAGVQKVDVIDKTTFALQLKNPYRPLLSLLATRSGFVPSPTAINKLGADFAKAPVGAGPFSLQEFRPGDYMKVRKVDNYWEKDKPYLDGVLFQNVPDEGVRLAMLRTDETDMIEDITPQLSDIVKRNPSLVLNEFPSDRMYTLAFDVTYSPFDNKALRQAVAYAVDRQKLAQAAFGGAARVASGYEASGWANNPNLTIPFDTQKAKAKLAEAGYPNGITLPIWCPSSSFWTQLCETYQAILSDSNIKLDIKLIPLADRINAWFDGRAHFGPQLRSPIAGDPGARFRYWFSAETVYNARMTRYFNPEVTRLLNEGDSLYDTQKAKAAYDKMQEILVGDVVWTFDVWVTVFTGLNKRVQNWGMIPDLYPRLSEIWLSGN